VDYAWPSSLTFPASEQRWINQNAPELVIQEFAERTLGRPFRTIHPFGVTPSKRRPGSG
jgi:hypothetical protein